MSRAVASSEPVTLQALAAASLYLLSLVAAGSATLAWHAPAASAAWQAAAAGALAAALLSGESVAAARARLGPWMRSGIWTAQLVYTGAAALVLLSLSTWPTGCASAAIAATRPRWSDWWRSAAGRRRSSRSRSGERPAGARRASGS